MSDMQCDTERPFHAKAFFALAATSLSFTILALYCTFSCTQRGALADSVRWQRWRLVGQAGVIVGLTGPLVVEGFGWDLGRFHDGRGQEQQQQQQQQQQRPGDLMLFRLLGLFGRRSKEIVRQ